MTGHDELPPHEDPTPEHPTDFVSKLTWNEYYHHFSRQLLEQFKWEITSAHWLIFPLPPRVASPSDAC